MKRSSSSWGRLPSRSLTAAGAAAAWAAAGGETLPDRLVHPAHGLVAELLELPRQAFADLTGAAFDLAPVARLYLQTLGETAFEATQRGCIRMLDGRAYELVEENQRVVVADLRDIAGAGCHASMINLG